jgi:Icc-related predicted phosphoesterase
LQGKIEHLETDADLKRINEKIGLLGFYSKVMSEDEFKALQTNPVATDTLFHELACERLQSWIDLAESRLAPIGIKCYVTGGNDDDPQVLNVLHESKAEFFIPCEERVVQIDDDHTMVSLAHSNPTPWKTPREVSDETLAQMIEKVVAQVSDTQHCIFNFHVPPVDSTLDTCPMLDWNTDPPQQIVKAGQVVMHGAGSQAVRHALERYQPVLGLHGHIHESQGAVRIGRTLCVNPGSEYGEGLLRGCLVNFVNGKIEGYQMTSG